MSDQIVSGEMTLRGFLPKPRIAVSLLFLVNGLYMGSWSAKVPEISVRLKLSPVQVSYLILALGVGSITLMPLVGSRIARLGSRKLSIATSLVFLPTLLFITFAPGFSGALVAFYLFGGLTGAMDVSMNANAVEVEKAMGRAIMSSCHAFWSLGGFLGSSTGGYLIEHLGATVHAMIVTGLCAVMLLATYPAILRDAPHRPETSDPAKSRSGLPRSPLPWLIGLMALFSMIQEGVVIDWSGLYLTASLGANLSVAALGAGAFHGTMMVMRFAGDAVRDRFGAVNTLRGSVVLAFAGMMVSGLASAAWIAILGFAIAGLGVANLIPIAFSTAGNLPGMAKGVGLSVVTVIGYSGALFAPTLFGFIIEHIGFTAVYLGVPLLLVVVLTFSHLARHADGIRGGGHG